MFDIIYGYNIIIKSESEIVNAPTYDVGIAFATFYQIILLIR